MTIMRTQLRKAAILISALDHRSADALLEQMGEEQAALVRDAVLELGDVDPAEQEQIVAEFVSGGAPAPRREPDSGVELELSSAGRTAGERRESADEPAIERRPPFQFLATAPTQVLVERLQRERPQAAALVLAHLPPQRAADVLAGFSASFQVDVLRRIAARSAADPQTVRELEDGLANVFADALQDETSADGLEALSAILSAAGGDARTSMVANLAQQDRRLVSRLGYAPQSRAKVEPPPAVAAESKPQPLPAPPIERRRDVPAAIAPPQPDESRLDEKEMPVDRPAKEVSGESPAPPPQVDFADLARLPDGVLAGVIRAADRDTLLMALAGAEPAVVNRFLRPLSPRDVKQFRKRMQKLEPLLLRDIERAQQLIAELASNLTIDAAPPTPRLAALA